MIVYVESNFVLELAFMQEEYESCDTIVGLAESRGLELVIPAFSIAEPYEVLVRRAKQRAELHLRLTREMRELARSKPYAEIVEQSREITTVLVQSGEEQKRQLDRSLSRVLECATVIPVGVETIKAAIGIQRGLGLSPQDSIVYASVVGHLAGAATGPKCLLDKDAKDFLNPDVQEQLARYECQLITSFSDGLAYIQRWRL